MIILTGDVHSKRLGNWEQKEFTEIKSAKKYLEILKKYKIKSTLFINGVCLCEDFGEVKDLLKFDVELGGHTYDNFGGMNVFKSFINRKIYKSVYGSSSYQERDIKRTKKAFEKIGLEMKSWRTHCYAGNEKTFEILSDNNVKFVSDYVGDIKPFQEKRIIHIPINIPPDQNTISYGILRPENRDPFASCTKSRINPEEWFEILKNRVIENEKKKIHSIILIHPSTMRTLDNFVLFGEIAKFLSKYKSIKISELKI